MTEQSETSAARRVATNLASGLCFNDTETGKVAVVVTEMATNLLKHAGSGQILMRADSNSAAPAVELLAIDSGPGMADPGACLRDGFSSAGSSGTGLGAITRMSLISEIYSVPGQGTIVRALCGQTGGAPDNLVEADGLSVPVAGEVECGDAFAIRQLDDELLVMVADGLGHGPGAAEASRAAVDAFLQTSERELTGMMQVLHTALRGTRGAAAAIAAISANKGLLRFCGVGNISTALIDGAELRHCVSMHGIVGHQIRTPRTFDYPWNGRTVVVMTSDGIKNSWDFRSMPGIRNQSPLMIAGAIYRAARRRTDDATVVVVKAGRLS